MDPLILKNRQFRHWQRSVTHLKAGDLADQGEHFDWLVADMNIESWKTVSWATKWIENSQRIPRGVFLTLKMNDEKATAAVPRWRSVFKDLGYSGVFLTQVPSHRKEMGLLAWKVEEPRKSLTRRLGP